MDTASSAPAAFSERPFWDRHPGAWHPLYGALAKEGWSLEWHDFKPRERIQWQESFHPNSLEVCLNLQGAGTVGIGGSTTRLQADSAAFYFRGRTPIEAWRESGERHQFLTLEVHRDFLKEHLPGGIRDARPAVREVLEAKSPASALGGPELLTPRLRLLVAALRAPPVSGAARKLWFTAKMFEIVAEMLFDHTAESELFCTRQTLIAQKRVEKAAALVRENLGEPLSLEELGARVGCSPFYLSRTFSQQMGMTLSRYQRQMRLERAAELLRSGKFNVTEAALEVGYSSIGHFSTAFHETFGCCPGLYPIRTPTQKAGKD